MTATVATVVAGQQSSTSTSSSSSSSSSVVNNNINNDMLSELRLENSRLYDDLCLEQQLNQLLDAIRNYSLILINSCHCNPNQEIWEKLNQLNNEYKCLRTRKLADDGGGGSDQHSGGGGGGGGGSDHTFGDILCNTSGGGGGGKQPHNTTVGLMATDPVTRQTTTAAAASMVTCVDCQQQFDSVVDLDVHRTAVHKTSVHQPCVCQECHQMLDSEELLSIHLIQNHFVCDIKTEDSNEDKSETLYANSATVAVIDAYHNQHHHHNHHHHQQQQHHQNMPFPAHTTGVGAGGSSGYDPTSGERIPENRSAFLSQLNLVSSLDQNNRNSCGENYGMRRLRDRPPKKVAIRRSSNTTTTRRLINVGTNNGLFGGDNNRDIIPEFKCDECVPNQWFNHERELEKHMNKQHKKLKPFACNVCTDTFFARLSLLYHMSQKHKILAFECQYCDYKTRTKHHLTQHMVRHSDVRPYECSVKGCELKFKRKDMLTRHEACHKKRGRSRPSKNRNNNNNNAADGLLVGHSSHQRIDIIV
ncbi:zinc finger protein 39-like [Oppia nitens]|uniref:zinc finger protein 39-like n=1 Tax=Oppia nitens TaxID=1686743 RepID=UPI0023DBE2E7|nr:zinc finger protein 39-like [Oppia nitens]